MLYLLQTYIQEDVVFIQSVRISRGTGNQSTTDVTAVCGHAENTSERREKEVQVSLDLPNAACVLLLVRYDWTRSGRRNLVVRNVVWNPVMRVNVPHASVHALGLALIVTSAISEPARVIAVKSALILRRQATAPLAVSAVRSSAAVRAIIAVVIRVIRSEEHTSELQS